MQLQVCTKLLEFPFLFEHIPACYQPVSICECKWKTKVFILISQIAVSLSTCVYVKHIHTVLTTKCTLQ